MTSNEVYTWLGMDPISDPDCLPEGAKVGRIVAALETAITGLRLLAQDQSRLEELTVNQLRGVIRMDIDASRTMLAKIEEIIKKGRVDT